MNLWTKWNRNGGQDGFAVAWLMITLPALIAVMGLAIDGSIVVYNRIKLDMAAEAASRGAIHSLDMEVWYSERRVVLDQARSSQIIHELLETNMPEARLVSIDIPDSAPNQCNIELEADVPLFFMKAFNVSSYIVRAKSSSMGYDPNQTSR